MKAANELLALLALASWLAAAVAADLRSHLLPASAPAVQRSAVRELIARTIGARLAQNFSVVVDPALGFRTFKLSRREHSIVSIEGSDGIAAAKGFHHYLKYYLRKDVTWTETAVGLLSVDELPNVTLASTSASDYIYYQNVCTWGYSFAWWSWSTWRRHIDWMAMMGVSLTIAPVQEQIWHDLYVGIGLTEHEIGDHFAGPAFQPWQRMGNIRGWGGPLPATYQRMQLRLQQRLLNAQRDLGMTVALPAFAGHVPTAMARLYPNVSFTPVERWNNFPSNYCCDLFLDPNEELFGQLTGEFMRRVIAAYGTDHIYFADPFNEVQPRQADTAYLNMTAFHIYAAMRAVDPRATWLLQGWMFVKNVFWSDELIKAFLTAVPRGRLLVLDLQSEQYPQYARTHSFHGQPFIWCMLHNFGGTLGMHGSVGIVNTGVRLARDMTNSSMVGVGITPEGIRQNYAMYAFALERAWLRDDVNAKAWFDHYADVRYGVQDVRLRAYWQLLRDSVYSYHGLKRMRGKYTITRRPALNTDTWTWYNASVVHQAWMLLLAANESVPQQQYARYEHDLVDVTRQFLQTTADRLYVNLVAAYKKRKLAGFTYIAEQLLGIFDDLESILATNEEFLLGPWLESARQMAGSAAERRLFEMNARNQITTWGPDGQILDYANKQWSGLVRDYYRPRWRLFLGMAEVCLREQTPFNRTAFNQIVSRDVEQPFSTQTTAYPLQPVGSAFAVAQGIFNRWTALLHKPAFKRNVQRSVRLIT